MNGIILCLSLFKHGNPVLSSIDTQLRNILTLIEKDLCSIRYITVLLRMTQTQNQPRHP